MLVYHKVLKYDLVIKPELLEEKLKQCSAKLESDAKCYFLIVKNLIWVILKRCISSEIQVNLLDLNSRF